MIKTHGERRFKPGWSSNLRTHHAPLLYICHSFHRHLYRVRIAGVYRVQKCPRHFSVFFFVFFFATNVVLGIEMIRKEWRKASQDQATSKNMPELPEDLPKQNGNDAYLATMINSPNAISLVKDDDKKAQVFVVPLQMIKHRKPDENPENSAPKPKAFEIVPFEAKLAPKLGKVFEIGLVIKNITIPGGKGAQERWEEVVEEIRVMEAMHGESFEWVFFPNGRGVYISFSLSRRVFYLEEDMENKKYGPPSYLRKVAIDSRITSKKAL